MALQPRGHWIYLQFAMASGRVHVIATVSMPLDAADNHGRATGDGEVTAAGCERTDVAG